MVVLDLEGRIVRTNRALRFLLEEGTPSHQVHFAEEWVQPDSRPDLLAAWARALCGERSRVRLRIRPSFFHVETVFELVPLLLGGLLRSVMLVMVDAVEADLPLPLVPALGTLYEVSLDGKGTPERLLRALSASRPSAPPGACYRSLHGRDRPCDQCPARGLAKDEFGTVVRLDESSLFQASLLSARRGQDDVASVTVVPLDQGAYAGLMKVRVEALSVKGKLSARERQVFASLVLGHKLGDIAAAAGITVRTARFHQQNLLRKLGASGRTGLFRLTS